MPEKKLSRSTQRRIKQNADRVERISILCANPVLSNAALETFFARAAISSFPDGFNSSSGAARVSGSGSDSTATESAVAARNPKLFPSKSGKTRTHFDPLARAADSLERLLRDAEKILEAAVNSVEYAQSDVKEKDERVWTSSPCPLGGEAIEVGGYCRTHFDNWVDYGRPNKRAWLLFKTQEEDENGEVIVKECPPPGTGQTARRGPYRADKVPNNAQLDTSV